jgi:hypothetical protein
MPNHARAEISIVNLLYMFLVIVLRAGSWTTTPMAPPHRFFDVKGLSGSGQMLSSFDPHPKSTKTIAEPLFVVGNESNMSQCTFHNTGGVFNRHDTEVNHSNQDSKFDRKNWGKKSVVWPHIEASQSATRQCTPVTRCLKSCHIAPMTPSAGQQLQKQCIGAYLWTIIDNLGGNDVIFDVSWT